MRFWNRALEGWTGIQRETIVGRPIAGFFENLQNPRYVERLQNVFLRGAPLILSSQLHGQILPCKLPSGAERTQHATVTAIPAEAGGFDALFAIQDVTDLTHRINNYRALRDGAVAAKAELEIQTQLLHEAHRELEQFSYVASHDLQEPLRTLAAYSSFLEEDAGDALTPQARQHLTHIRGAARRMQSVIQDLLTLSRASKTGFHAELVSLDTCFHNACEALHVLISEASATIRAEPLPEVMGVNSLLEQVFQNLLSNSIKFRRTNVSPDIRVSVEQADGEWLIRFADNGQGIEPRHVHKVFEPFVRLHPHHEIEGSGVGLATCKSILQRHGGRIWAERREPPGAVICLTIPPIAGLQEGAA